MTRLGKALCLFLFIVSVAMNVFGQTKSTVTVKQSAPSSSVAKASAQADKPDGSGSASDATKANETKSTDSGTGSAASSASGTSASSTAASAAGTAVQPTPQAGAAAGQTAPPAGMDGSTYQVRLRDLEQKVDELKEQIRRSHTRLSLLSETILSGGTGGARAEITFINDMSSAFRMTQALFVLDGAVQYNKQDETGVLAGQKEIPIFSGSIPPGDHTLQVLVKLRGHGYGVFSYLQGYRFEIRSSHSFTITEGKTIELKAIAFEKGDVTTPIEQRPAVRYHKNVRTGLQAGGASPMSDARPAVSGSKSLAVSIGRQ